MAQYPIIGIAGKARSGKDTTARFIIAERGGYQYAFADPIRQMARIVGVDMREQYWQDRKEEVIPALGVSPRCIMQTLGSWGRDTNPQFWINLAVQRLWAMGPGMVISDVRYENEADWIRRQGGRIIHLYRDEAPEVEAHHSENGIAVQEGDGIIYNNGSLEDLQLAVKDILHEA